MSSDAERIAAAIPAEFHMISGSQDRQTSADVFNTNKVCEMMCLLYNIMFVSDSGWCSLRYHVVTRIIIFLLQSVFSFIYFSHLIFFRPFVIAIFCYL